MCVLVECYTKPLAILDKLQMHYSSSAVLSHYSMFLEHTSINKTEKNINVECSLPNSTCLRGRQTKSSMCESIRFRYSYLKQLSNKTTIQDESMLQYPRRALVEI